MAFSYGCLYLSELKLLSSKALISFTFPCLLENLGIVKTPEQMKQ